MGTDVGETSSDAAMASASGKETNAMEASTVTTGAMRPQRYVGPTVRRWMEGGPVTMGNASRKVGNAMDGRHVMMAAMTPQSYVEPTVRM